MAQRRKILRVAWDAAELNIIMSLVDAGEMPHLERLINHGAIGRLNTIQPLFSPLGIFEMTLSFWLQIRGTAIRRTIVRAGSSQRDLVKLSRNSSAANAEIYRRLLRQ